MVADLLFYIVTFKCHVDFKFLDQAKDSMSKTCSEISRDVVERVREKERKGKHPFRSMNITLFYYSCKWSCTVSKVGQPPCTAHPHTYAAQRTLEQKQHPCDEIFNAATV